jgi:hypothetical protein
MKMYKSAVYLSILALASAPSIRCMDSDGNDDGSNSSPITLNELTYTPHNSPVNEDLFDLSTDKSALEFKQRIDQMKLDTPDLEALESKKTNARTGATIGALATVIYGIKTFDAAPILATVRNHKFAPLPIMATQGIIDIIAQVAPAVFGFGTVLYCYEEIRRNAGLEHELKMATRREHAATDEVQRLRNALKQHEQTMKDVVVAEHNLLVKDNKSLLSAQYKKGCDSCLATQKIIQSVVERNTKQIGALKSIHDDIPLILNEGNNTHSAWNPKSWFGKIRDLCKTHHHEEPKE